jgi:23S rRNA (uracil1939-C5)-methyltransferase
MANFFKAKTNKKPNNNLNPVTLSIKIDKLDNNGCGVGQYKSKPIFIESALPNELVEVRLIEEKNKFSRAKLINIVDESTYRVDPKCKHFSRCGGCDLQHLTIAEQILFKENKTSSLMSRVGLNQESIAKLPWQNAVQSLAWHYRRKARIGVQYNKKGQATIGFREKSSNQLVSIKSCPVLAQPIDKIFPILSTLVNELSVKNAIGHIEVIAAETAIAEVKTTLVIRQLRTLKASDLALIKTFSEKYQWQVIFDHGKTVEPDKEQSVSVNSLHADTSPKDVCQSNMLATLAYSLNDNVTIQFNQGDFIQINETMNVKMVDQALDWLDVKKSVHLNANQTQVELASPDNILDLFCGLGNFSLALAKYAHSVVGVEGVQAMVDKATLNAQHNALKNVTFHQADLNDPSLCALVMEEKGNTEHWIKKSYNKVLLDPARAGAEQAVKFISQLRIPTILYVSCDPQTLAKDSQVLLEQGYNIVKISTLDMFVHTKHVETMVLFKLNEDK